MDKIKEKISLAKDAIARKWKTVYRQWYCFMVL